MKLPGLIALKPEQRDLIKKAADMVGESFLEEPWYAMWVSSLDAIGATDQRKLEIVRASFYGNFLEHAAYEGVYITEDMAACAGAYLSSELRGQTHEEIESRGESRQLSGLLTAEEASILDDQARRMEAVSDFSWASEAANGEDHIYVYGWAVDREKRGSGALRRMVDPFFSYADERGLDMFLDCYSDNLQSLYEHLGFEVLSVLSAPSIPITERRMVRRPRAVAG